MFRDALRAHVGKPFLWQLLEECVHDHNAVHRCHLTPRYAAPCRAVACVAICWAMLRFGVSARAGFSVLAML